MAKHTLKLSIDIAVKDLEAQILKRHKNSIKNFNKLVQDKFKSNIEIIDFLTGTPHLLIRQSIEEALLLSLNGDKEYLILDLEI